MPGPPPSPTARRRNSELWRQLPATGREDDPPAFPLQRPSKAVVALWAELWASPQAIVWEEFGWTRVVARYAKLCVAAEKPAASTSLLAEVRQLEDRLGLSPMSMQRLRWQIVDAPAESDESADVTRLDDYRARLA